MKTIWFNRGHSLLGALQLIKRAGGDRIRLLVSHPHADAPALAAADLRLIEPPIDAGYVDWCLATCRAHRVDLFVPGEARDAIAAAADRFAARGTRVALAAPADRLAAIEDKAAFTAAAAAHGLPVARTMLVRDGAGLHAAVANLAAAGLDACVKPPCGVFGAGYWRLADTPLFAALMHPDARILPPATMAAALDATPGAELLVMEHLPGTETSVDLLAHHGRTLAAVARIKGRVSQHVVTDGPAIDLATATAAAFDLHGIVNVQMIEDAAGQPRLIEVNPRMAGACLHTLFVGAVLPWWWVAIELGLATPDDVPRPSGEAWVAAVPGAIDLGDPARTLAALIAAR
jgi:carbamoylphosphate synthase large subunit